MLSWFLVALLSIIVLCLILNIFGQPLPPLLIGRDNEFLNVLLKTTPQLKERYVPTRLWGLSPHFQTILRAFVVGRFSRSGKYERKTIKLQDGATLYYDLYEPAAEKLDDDLTIAVYPGIANYSDQLYLLSFAKTIQKSGIRCVIASLLGAREGEALTSPRVFTLANTSDYHSMLLEIEKSYPKTKIISCGFSMGGNTVLKYLGEPYKDRPRSIIGAIAICGGVDVQTVLDGMSTWHGLAHVYMKMFTEKVRNGYLRNMPTLYNDEIKKRYGVREEDMLNAKSMDEVQLAYECKINGLSLYEWYEQTSAKNYMDNITAPLIVIHSSDDPYLNQYHIQHYFKKFVMTRDNALHVDLAHGGHLGFAESGIFWPKGVWIDRTAVSLAKGLLLKYKQSAHKLPVNGTANGIANM